MRYTTKDEVKKAQLSVLISEGLLKGFLGKVYGEDKKPNKVIEELVRQYIEENDDK